MGAIPGSLTGSAWPERTAEAASQKALIHTVHIRRVQK